MINQFGDHLPITASQVGERKVRTSSVVQCGMNEYYIVIWFFRDPKRYVLYGVNEPIRPRTFMSIDTAARFLRQNFVRKIEVIME